MEAVLFLQFSGQSVGFRHVFEGHAFLICVFRFFCTKIDLIFCGYRTGPHFHFLSHGSILVFEKEVSSTMYDCSDLMEMQQRWGAEERKIVSGVKTLIQYLFHS